MPHFTLSSDSYELSHRLLLKSLQDTMSQKQSRPPTLFPWSSLARSEQMEFPAPKCEHIVYLQQHPVVVDGVLADRLLIERMEQELRYPMGAPIPNPPLMTMSAVVYTILMLCEYVLLPSPLPWALASFVARYLPYPPPCRHQRSLEMKG